MNAAEGEPKGPFVGFGGDVGAAVDGDSVLAAGSTAGSLRAHALGHVVAGDRVVWRSYFSPFTSSGAVFWGLLVFFAMWR